MIKRDEEGTTAMGDGIAIPHAKSTAVDEAVVVFARSDEGVDWDSIDDQPVKLIFMILVPEHQKGDLHLKILQVLARNLMHDEFKQYLLNATTKEEVLEILKEVG